MAEAGGKARLVGINHVALEVGDIDQALAFYGRLFEFSLRGRSASMAFIDMGDQFIALSTGRSQAKDEDRHFGLVVDDRAPLRQALQEMGAEVLPGRGLDFIDPGATTSRWSSTATSSSPRRPRSCAPWASMLSARLRPRVRSSRTRASGLHRKRLRWRSDRGTKGQGPRGSDGKARADAISAQHSSTSALLPWRGAARTQRDCSMLHERRAEGRARALSPVAIGSLSGTRFLEQHPPARIDDPDHRRTAPLLGDRPQVEQGPEDFAGPQGGIFCQAAVVLTCTTPASGDSIPVNRSAPDASDARLFKKRTLASKRASPAVSSSCAGGVAGPGSDLSAS